MIAFVLAMALGGAPTPAQAARGPLVATIQGPVEGKVVNSQAQFFGIPYGEPPVGDLRWRPPQPAARWTEPLRATAFGKSCPQLMGPGPMDARHDESCLFLNVFTPAATVNGKARLPVMVWIYGGGLEAGETNNYDGAKLARQGVVVVTLNYRLGVLGFFSHPNIDREGHAFANYGLMDQQLALKWVRDNIAAFGGDPGNVTIFGESAGGGSVFAQLASPMAAGLFHKAIVQSGSYVAVQSTEVTPIEQAQTMGRYFSMAAGCQDLSPACLRKVPVQKLLQLQPAYEASFIVDGELIPMRFSEAFATGRFSRVPVLNGANLDEWRLMVAMVERSSGQKVTPESYAEALRANFSPTDRPYQLIAATPSEVATKYPLQKYDSAPEALAAAEGDAFMSCPALKMNSWLSRYVPTYAYEFTYRDAPTTYLPPASFPYGATHTAELQFLFPNIRWRSDATIHPLNGREQALSDRMVEYWTTFAKAGVPTTSDTSVVSWPRFTVGDPRMMKLDLAASVDDRFSERHQCQFWGEASLY
ncbi:MAG: carboxylesterase/lipase family protein [Hyphomonadaceae bacterium]|nr:carboxylesterase/lipase family protein [Hyphomonadaceae bacterium]